MDVCRSATYLLPGPITGPLSSASSSIGNARTASVLRGSRVLCLAVCSRTISGHCQFAISSRFPYHFQYQLYCTRRADIQTSIPGVAAAHRRDRGTFVLYTYIHPKVTNGFGRFRPTATQRATDDITTIEPRYILPTYGLPVHTSSIQYLCGALAWELPPRAPPIGKPDPQANRRATSRGRRKVDAGLATKTAGESLFVGTDRGTAEKQQCAKQQCAERPWLW